eukprot:gene5273-29590_t
MTLLPFGGGGGKSKDFHKHVEKHICPDYDKVLIGQCNIINNNFEKSKLKWQAHYKDASRLAGQIKGDAQALEKAKCGPPRDAI